MGLRQPSGRLRREPHHLVHLQRTTGDLLFDRLALVVGHGDEKLAVRSLADFVYVADVGVVECGRRLCFPQKASLERCVETPLGRKELERHGTAELDIDGPVENPHPSGAEHLDYLVVGNRAADQSMGIRRTFLRFRCRRGAKARLRDEVFETAEELVGLIMSGKKSP